jgi:uncharacterized protein YodC (DUF2158 family)
MAAFPVGTIVWLKSGGPPLTVTDIGAYPRVVGAVEIVEVEWFAGDVLRRDAILKDSLTTEMPTNARS